MDGERYATIADDWPNAKEKADLISATPDMNEACKLAHRALMTGDAQEKEEALTAIEKALAKAEGQP